MEFIDLQRQQQQIKSQVRQNIERVLAHGRYINGPEVAELEGCLEALLGNKTHAVACANGTDAIQVACMALELEPGAEVITPALSFMATVEVPVLLGLKPVFVDVDERTGNLDPSQLQAALSEKTRLILPVSLYGQCADYTEIQRIVGDIPVLEDGAESFGAKHKGQFSGSLTELATSSFFPAKPLGCYGDGGVVFAKDKQLAEKIRRICLHGQKSRYCHAEIGVNSRLDTLQAAVLLAKLDILQAEHDKKQQIAEQYYAALRGKVGLLEVQPGNESAHGYFPILVEQRSVLQQALQREGIPYSVHFPCLHTQPAIAKLGYREGDFPVAERIARQVLTLPMHAYLTEAEIQQVLNCVLENV